MKDIEEPYIESNKCTSVKCMLFRIAKYICVGVKAQLDFKETCVVFDGIGTVYLVVNTAV